MTHANPYAWWILAGVAATLGAPTRGAAQAPDTCGPTVPMGPLSVTPASGARNVRLDAPVRVRYSPAFFDAPGPRVDPASRISLLQCADARCTTSVEVAGAVEVIGDELVFVPARDLLARTDYRGTARGAERDLMFVFQTGADRDVGPPVLGAIEDVRSSYVDQSCERDGGGYRVEVSFPPATDDGPPGDIEYLLYQTRGPELSAPVLRARARNFSTTLVTMAFILDPAEAVSPVCVVVHAVDGVGRVDDDGELQCFDPVVGNYFAPLCSVAAAGPLEPSDGATPWVFAGLAVATVHGRRRRRNARQVAGRAGV